MFASIFKAAKSTGYKFSCILHRTAWIGDCENEQFFDTKAEAKQWAKDNNAQPHNY